MRAWVLAISVVPALAFASPDRSQAERRPPHVAIENGLSRQQIDRVVRAHSQRLRRCYERELNRNPAAADGGKVVVQFTIDKRGEVTSARIASSTMKIRTIEQCIVAEVRRLRFPAADAPSFVTYPFLFSAR